MCTPPPPPPLLCGQWRVLALSQFAPYEVCLQLTTKPPPHPPRSAFGSALCCHVPFSGVNFQCAPLCFAPSQSPGIHWASPRPAARGSCVVSFRDPWAGPAIEISATLVLAGGVALNHNTIATMPPLYTSPLLIQLQQLQCQWHWGKGPLSESLSAVSALSSFRKELPGMEAH